MYTLIGQICYDIGEGGGAAGGGTGEPAHPIAAPWTGTEGVWQLGEEGAQQPWWNSIPEPEARQHVEAKQYATPGELALANYNLTKMQRGADDVLTIPAPDAAPEEIDAFHKKLGRPDTVDAYDFKFADGFEADPDMLKFGKEAFFEMGLNNAQAQKFADKWNGFVQEQNEALLKAERDKNTADMQALEARWGADLAKNKAAGQRVVEALGVPDLINQVEKHVGVASMVELLATIGRKSDEGGLVLNTGNKDPNDPAMMTKEEANAKIVALAGDEEFQKKYTNAEHPEHKQALKLMEQLYAKA